MSPSKPRIYYLKLKTCDTRLVGIITVILILMSPDYSVKLSVILISKHKPDITVTYVVIHEHGPSEVHIIQVMGT